MKSINWIHSPSLPKLFVFLIHAGSRRRSFHSPGGGERSASENSAQEADGKVKRENSILIYGPGL
jgi:hypothetical protein